MNLELVQRLRELVRRFKFLDDLAFAAYESARHPGHRRAQGDVKDAHEGEDPAGLDLQRHPFERCSTRGDSYRS